MGFLRLFGVPEGMSAAEARELRRLESHGISRETSVENAPERSTVALSDDDSIEVTG